MKKFIVFVISFIVGLVVLMPKENLYFTLQHFLKEKKIYINSDIYSGIALVLKDGTIFYNNIDIMNFKNIKVYPFIFFNSINVDSLKINFEGLKIKKLNIIYSIANPKRASIKGESNFGKIDGYIDIFDRKIKIYILNLNNSNLKRLLKKDKQGFYYYGSF